MNPSGTQSRRVMTEMRLAGCDDIEVRDQRCAARLLGLPSDPLRMCQLQKAAKSASGSLRVNRSKGSAG